MFEPEANGIKILFDAGNKIRQQYISMKQPYAEEIFNSWFEKNVLKQIVDIIDLNGTKNHYAELNALGLPKSEHVYFRVAIEGKATLIVSLDSDFYDPAQKGAGEKKKRALIKSGKGPVCKFMKRSHKIDICCPARFCAT